MALTDLGIVVQIIVGSGIVGGMIYGAGKLRGTLQRLELDVAEIKGDVKLIASMDKRVAVLEEKVRHLEEENDGLRRKYHDVSGQVTGLLLNAGLAQSGE